MHDLVRRQAERSPEAPVLLAPGREAMSYGELLAQAEATVKGLNEFGIGRNDRVAMVLPNGPEMAAALVGVACAATCAPLNPNYHEEEFAFGFEDLGVRALLVLKDSGAAARAAAEKRGLALIELWPEMDGPAGTFTLKCLRGPGEVSGKTGWSQSDDLIYLLHTSGTTAKPKIVPLRHRNVCAAVCTNSQFLELTPSDRCINIMSLFHSMGMTAINTSLAAGAAVICPPGFQAPQFFGWVQTMRPTWYTASPAIHTSIVQRSADYARLGREEKTLRFTRSGSSALPTTVLQELERVFECPLIEGYGMSEAPLITSNRTRAGGRRTGSVGKPCGMEVAVWDEASGRMLGAGARGEVVIRGPHLMVGYENNPKANASSYTAEGWFRTGDVGHLDEDGYLYLTGRTKEIINRGGAKVAPHEVDEVLRRHPAVADALTFAMPDAKLGEDVASAVVLKASATASELELRQHAAARMVDYKVPRRIVFLAEIPLGPTGKPQRVGMASRLGLDKAAEAGTGGGGNGAGAAASVAPRTPLEEALADIWAQVLGVERIGIHENFMESGGDSILAVSLFAEIERVLGKNLPVATLLAAPTIAELAVAIEREGWSLGQAHLVRIQAGNGSRPTLFCLPGKGGHVFNYYALSRHLGADQPLYGLQLPGVDGRQTPHTRIPELAALFIEQIRALQPQGPYHLGGYSFGGRVAYEMARQLAEQDEGNVGLLVLFDTAAPGYPRKLPLLRRVAWHCKKILSLKGSARWEYARHRMHALMDRVRSGPSRTLYPSVNDDPSLPESLRDVEQASIDAMRSYVARPYNGRLVLLRAEEQGKRFIGCEFDEAMGWSRLARRGVEVRAVPGSHLTMLGEPHVRGVAAALRGCLDASLGAAVTSVR